MSDPITRVSPRSSFSPNQCAASRFIDDLNKSAGLDKLNLNLNTEVIYSPEVGSSQDSIPSGIRRRNVGGVDENNQVREDADEIDSPRSSFVSANSHFTFQPNESHLRTFSGTAEKAPATVSESKNDVHRALSGTAAEEPAAVSEFKSQVDRIVSKVAARSAATVSESASDVHRRMKDNFSFFVERTKRAKDQVKTPKSRLDFIGGMMAIVVAAAVCAANMVGASLSVMMLIGFFTAILIKALNNIKLKLQS